MDDDTLRRLAIDVNLDNLALGNEVFGETGATFVRNTAFPRVYDANFACRVRARTPAEIDALLTRADEVYAHCRHRCFRVTNDVAPEFEARLALDGYVQTSVLIAVLEGELVGTAEGIELREITDDAGWDAFFALNVADWEEHADRTKISAPDSAALGRELAASQRVKSPPVRYWLAYTEGAPRGYFNAWEGTQGVGQVENLFVLKEWRHRGLATALIHRCVADARAGGAGPVVIVSDPTDTPKQMYAAMGFRAVATQRSWVKTLA
jgi:GNAT superfamily N-acetyltransferase